MKKLLTSLFALASLTSFGTPLLYDGFDYSLSPTNLPGQVNPGGKSWDWAAPTTAAATNNQPSIFPNSLSYTGLAPSVGNSVLFGGNGASTRLAWGPQLSSGSIYYSLILKITDITSLNATTPQFFVAATSTSGSGTPNIIVTGLNAVKVDATHYRLGIKKAGAGIVSANVTNTMGDVVFVVCSYTFVSGPGSGTADQARLWINPDPSTFGAATPPTETLLSTGSADLATGNTIGGMTIFNRSTSEPDAMILDELTAGTTWADVTPTASALAILTQPTSQRSVIGGDASFSAISYRATTNQWQHNGVDIPGAHSTSLTLTNIQLSDAGTYTLIVGNGLNSQTSSNAVLTVYPDIYPRLVPLWSLAAGSRPYLTIEGSSAPKQRSFAYSSLSNQVLLVSRTNTATLSGSPAIYVLNGDTGADLYQMNTDPTVIQNIGANTNTLTLNCIDMSADGSIFAANVGDSTAAFYVYYWTNSDPSTPPQMIFTGDASGGLISNQPLRFGDSLAVRGSGPNTQMLFVDSTGVCGSLLTPQPGQPLNASSWYSFPFTNASGGNSTGGRTVLLSANDNTVWEKYGSSPLELIAFDTNALSSSIVTNIPNVFGAPNLVAFTANTNLLFGIDRNSSSSAPDTLNQYDLSDPANPLFVRSYNFPLNSQPNSNGNGRVLVSGDRVYALDSNNGLLAFRIAPVLSITPSGANVVLAWPGSTPGYTLQATPSLQSPVTWTNVGPGTLIGQQFFATNSASAGALFYRLQK